MSNLSSSGRRSATSYTLPWKDPSIDQKLLVVSSVLGWGSTGLRLDFLRRESCIAFFGVRAQGDHLLPLDLGEGIHLIRCRGRSISLELREATAHQCTKEAALLPSCWLWHRLPKAAADLPV